MNSFINDFIFFRFFAKFLLPDIILIFSSIVRVRKSRKNIKPVKRCLKHTETIIKYSYPPVLARCVLGLCLIPSGGTVKKIFWIRKCKGRVYIKFYQNIFKSTLTQMLNSFWIFRIYLNSVIFSLEMDLF